MLMVPLLEYKYKNIIVNVFNTWTVNKDSTVFCIQFSFGGGFFKTVVAYKCETTTALKNLPWECEVERKGIDHQPHSGVVHVVLAFASIAVSAME